MNKNLRDLWFPVIFFYHEKRLILISKIRTKILSLHSCNKTISFEKSILIVAFLRLISVTLVQKLVHSQYFALWILINAKKSQIAAFVNFSEEERKWSQVKGDQILLLIKAWTASSWNQCVCVWQLSAVTWYVMMILYIFVRGRLKRHTADSRVRRESETRRKWVSVKGKWWEERERETEKHGCQHVSCYTGD